MFCGCRVIITSVAKAADARKPVEKNGSFYVFRKQIVRQQTQGKIAHNNVVSIVLLKIS